MPKPILRSDVLEMKDLKPGMILKGTVRNVIDFGVFVDIGVHQDGLVHISQITNKFIKHPLEAVSVGDIVDVKVQRSGSPSRCGWIRTARRIPDRNEIRESMQKSIVKWTFAVSYLGL